MIVPALIVAFHVGEFLCVVLCPITYLLVHSSAKGGVAKLSLKGSTTPTLAHLREHNLSLALDEFLAHHYFSAW